MTDAVPTDRLQAVAAMAPVKTNGHKPAAGLNGHARNFGHRLLVDKWLQTRGVSFELKDKGDHTVYVISCPFNPEHKHEANITQNTDGALSASCFHDSCRSKQWDAFRDKIGKPDPDHYDPPLLAGGKGSSTALPPLPDIVSIGTMILQYEHLRPVVVDGLLRQGEVLNFIAKSKVGKSWAVYGLLLSAAAGLHWLEHFRCTPACVLLIDDELHAETLAHRLWDPLESTCRHASLSIL